MFKTLAQDLFAKQLKPHYEGIEPLPRSLEEAEGTWILMVRLHGAPFLFAAGEGPLLEALEGQGVAQSAKLAPLSHKNRLVLNQFFPYTAPRANKDRPVSVGLGDRLGLATPGHIDAIRKTGAFPIFAQQSMRELHFTHRTYADVIDAAAFAVFQEGYREGYGADGDHLKTKKDILDALAIGVSMITLDSSDHIAGDILDLSDDALLARYLALPESLRESYEARYLKEAFPVKDLAFSFSRKDLMENVLIYDKALDFMEDVHHSIIKTYDRPLDFEISIDETATPTDPLAHFFIGKELERRGVRVTTLAPRFIGEFQKGVDYMGDLDAFLADFKIHVAIAHAFGYRLSIHSGSDKFSIFPLIAEHTGGNFHVKTAGTNWLEALRVIARKEPVLYRRLHAFALQKFPEAAAFYHVTTDLSKVAPLEDVADQDLPKYLEENDARQMLHITYGYMLTERDDRGRKVFAPAFFEALRVHSEEYRTALSTHIGRHLALLGLTPM